MTTPLISIIIPAYNSGAFLTEALKSAASQDWQRTEIIVVDDGSDTAGAEFIRDCVRSTPSVTLIRQENAGLSAARNKGADSASGEYLAFLDHDDIWHCEFLSSLAGLFDSEDVGASFCAFEHLTERGRRLNKFSNPKTTNLTITDFLISDPVGCGSSFLVKNSAFHAINGFDPKLRMAETPDFFIRLIAAGWRVRGTKQPLVLYRNTPGSLSCGNGLSEAREYVFRKARRAHPEMSRFQALLIWLKMHANLLSIRGRKSTWLLGK